MSCLRPVAGTLAGTLSGTLAPGRLLNWKGLISILYLLFHLVGLFPASGKNVGLYLRYAATWHIRRVNSDTRHEPTPQGRLCGL
ncbi:hypothetical protein BDV26DRAFT_101720 [Aspergillus bertholletiae]|uniref:Uncharacterized protein n=1 Tax=Aspergillus bertholletiae TaxID=1226010 RepID=A0A5N7BI02_9EURO|nr:hypothetical protein BDV26DRAFT_101720 [Aspergillus bertholletiae]